MSVSTGPGMLIHPPDKNMYIALSSLTRFRTAALPQWYGACVRSFLPFWTGSKRCPIYEVGSRKHFYHLYRNVYCRVRFCSPYFGRCESHCHTPRPNEMNNHSSTSGLTLFHPPVAETFSHGLSVVRLNCKHVCSQLTILSDANTVGSVAAVGGSFI